MVPGGDSATTGRGGSNEAVGGGAAGRGEIGAPGKGMDDATGCDGAPGKGMPGVTGFGGVASGSGVSGLMAGEMGAAGAGVVGAFRILICVSVMSAGAAGAGWPGAILILISVSGVGACGGVFAGVGDGATSARRRKTLPMSCGDSIFLCPASRDNHRRFNRDSTTSSGKVIAIESYSAPTSNKLMAAPRNWPKSMRTAPLANCGRIWFAGMEMLASPNSAMGVVRHARKSGGNFSRMGCRGRSTSPLSTGAAGFGTGCDADAAGFGCNGTGTGQERDGAGGGTGSFEPEPGISFCSQRANLDFTFMESN